MKTYQKALTAVATIPVAGIIALGGAGAASASCTNTTINGVTVCVPNNDGGVSGGDGAGGVGTGGGAGAAPGIGGGGNGGQPAGPPAGGGGPATVPQPPVYIPPAPPAYVPPAYVPPAYVPPVQSNGGGDDGYVAPQAPAQQIAGTTVQQNSDGSYSDTATGEEVSAEDAGIVAAEAEAKAAAAEAKAKAAAENAAAAKAKASVTATATPSVTDSPKTTTAPAVIQAEPASDNESNPLPLILWTLGGIVVVGGGAVGFKYFRGRRGTA
ncbi:hypothetical protein [Arthrobacter sp. lap29]|uniref:hypothetical protein n=1 Tax=Arthrobacter sp. lap29 TaxID=3056122 RepID=UPI0028F6EC92|nr:hypothetical protein [Arthrobacter sp. lap29]